MKSNYFRTSAYNCTKATARQSMVKSSWLMYTNIFRFFKMNSSVKWYCRGLGSVCILLSRLSVVQIGLINRDLYWMNSQTYKFICSTTGHKLFSFRICYATGSRVTAFSGREGGRDSKRIHCHPSILCYGESNPYNFPPSRSLKQTHATNSSLVATVPSMRACLQLLCFAWLNLRSWRWKRFPFEISCFRTTRRYNRKEHTNKLCETRFNGV